MPAELTSFVDAVTVAPRSRAWPPRVLLLGGCDVHLRIDLMRALAGQFEFIAAGSDRELAHRFTRAGFPFRYYPLHRGLNPLSDAFSGGMVVRLCRDLRPHIVHAFATKPCVWGRIAARLAGVPIIVGTLPGLGSLYTYRNFQSNLARAAYRPLQKAASHLADFTIFQNDEDAAELVGTGVVPAMRATVIPGSGVRTEIFDPETISSRERTRVREELGLPPDTVVVTMISRLIRSKGVIEFMEAAKLLRSDFTDVHFLLVGPRDEGGFDRLTDEEMERLGRTVQWTGARSDIPALLAISDLFVLPTYYREGIPRVLLEAASMGLPLVTTRVAGCAEVACSGENGIVVPPRDPRALALAIARLLADAQLRQTYGRRSREIATTRFDVAVIARATARLYDHLLSKKRVALGRSTE